VYELQRPQPGICAGIATGANTVCGHELQGALTRQARANCKGRQRGAMGHPGRDCNGTYTACRGGNSIGRQWGMRAGISNAACEHEFQRVPMDMQVGNSNRHQYGMQREWPRAPMWNLGMNCNGDQHGMQAGIATGARAYGWESQLEMRRIEPRSDPRISVFRPHQVEKSFIRSDTGS